MDEKEKEYWESFIEAWKEGKNDRPYEWSEKSKILLSISQENRLHEQHAISNRNLKNPSVWV